MSHLNGYETMQNVLKLMTSIDGIIEERTKRYGDFEGTAKVSTDLKERIRHHIYDRDAELKPDQWEALDMICHKMARIINGDPDYIDSWDDIAGYAKLVADRLRREKKEHIRNDNVIQLQPDNNGKKR